MILFEFHRRLVQPDIDIARTFAFLFLAVSLNGP